MGIMFTPESLEKLKIGGKYLGSTALGGGIGSLLGAVEAAKLNRGDTIHTHYRPVTSKKERKKNMKASMIAGGIAGGLGGAYIYGKVRSLDKLEKAREARYAADKAKRAEEQAKRNAEWERARQERQKTYDEWDSSRSKRNDEYNKAWEEAKRARDRQRASSGYGGGYNRNSSGGSGGSSSSGRSSGYGRGSFDTHKDTMKGFGVNVDSIKTKAEFKKAYRDLAKQYHPDINKAPGADEKFKKVNNAYEAMKNSSWHEKLARLIQSLGMEKIANQGGEDMEKLAIYKEAIEKMAKRGPETKRLGRKGAIIGTGVGAGVTGAGLALGRKIAKSDLMSGVSSLLRDVDPEGAKNMSIARGPLGKYLKKVGPKAALTAGAYGVVGGAIGHLKGKGKDRLKKKADYKEGIEKMAGRKNETSFGHDRLLSSIKSGIIGGIPGSMVGSALGVRGGEAGIKAGMLLGGAVGKGTASAVRAKLLNEKMRGKKKLDADDYAKTFLAGAGSKFLPGVGLTNTPEAVIKHKIRTQDKRAAEYKEEIEKLAFSGFNKRRARRKMIEMSVPQRG